MQIGLAFGAVSRYQHPVRGVHLLVAPEMRVLHPAERESTVTTDAYDEGAGCGFDNGSADAYVERWVEVDAGALEVLTWFASRFLDLGWTADAPVPTSGVAYMRFHRDPEERLGVLLQGMGDWMRHPERDVQWDAGVNSMRVHLAVDGAFPDGSTGFQVG